MRSECIECRICYNYFCTWCEKDKTCDGCARDACEDCGDDFQECPECKNNFCSVCAEDFDCENMGCDFKACQACMSGHSHEIQDKETTPAETP